MTSASIVYKTEPKDFIRTALSFGLDRAYQIDSEYSTDHTISPMQIARCIQKVYEKEKPFLILMGKQSIDSETGSVPATLSSLLDIPFASNLSQIELIDNKKALVQREIESGTDVLEYSLPLIASCDLRLNVPRIPNFKSMLAAKKKPIIKIDVNIKGGGNLEVRLDEYEFPNKKPTLISVDGIFKLINELKQ